MPTLRSFALVLVGSGFVLGAVSPSAVVAAPSLASDGPKVHVEGDLPNPKSLEKARLVVETTLALAEKRIPYRLPDGQRILLHLHATEQSFVDAMGMTNETPTGGPSGTDAKTHVSRVLVTPRSEASYLAAVDDLPELTRYHVAFETVVQLLRRAEAPSMDRWPAWYFQGLCDTIASDAITPAVGSRPIFVDDALANLREVAAAGRLLPVERLLVADEVGIEAMRRVEAQWNALHRVFGAEPAKAATFHESIRRLPVLPKPALGERDHSDVATSRAVARVLQDVYGPPESLDPKLAAYAAGVKPERFDVLRWSQGNRDELVCAAPDGSTAIVVEETPPPGAPFTVTCDLFVHDLGRRQAELYLAYGRRDDPRFLKLALLSVPAKGSEGPQGFVTLLAYADGAWQSRLRVNQSVPAETFAPGKWIPIQLVVHSDRLRLDVEGKKLLEIPSPDGFDVLNGRLGFGAFAEVVRFRKIVVAPLAAEPK